METQISTKIAKYQCYSDEHVLCDIVQVCIILESEVNYLVFS